MASPIQIGLKRPTRATDNDGEEFQAHHSHTTPQHQVCMQGTTGISAQLSHQKTNHENSLSIIDEVLRQAERN